MLFPDIIERPAPPAEPEGLYEVVDGQVVEKATGAYEAELGWILLKLLLVFTEERQLGRSMTEILYDLRPAVDRERRPDVAFLSAERWPLARRAPRSAAWPVAPDLAVEIVSPSNTMTSVMEKIEEYFRAGVRLVWVVLPDQRRIYAYTSPTAVRVVGPGDELDGGPVLPGFRLDVGRFFGDEAAG